MDIDISDRRLATAAGLEVFDEGSDLILASPAGMLRLSGGVADVVGERLLPALASEPGRRGLLAALADLPASEVSRLVDRLIEAGMVTERGPQPVPEWLSLVSTDAATRDALAARLAAVRLLVIAGEGDAAGLAALAGDAGIGGVECWAPEGLLAEELAERVAGRDLVICAVDPGWAAVRTWVNRACLDAGTPALFVAFEGSYASLGPLVLPGEGPCYLCWRMRALACSDDFEVAMAREESLDATRAALGRPLLPGLRETAWGIVLRETLALTTSALPPELPGTVLLLDQLKGTSTRNPVTPRPDCPACRKKDPPPPAAPTESTESTDFDRIATQTVSQVCGLIRYLDEVAKPVEEPRQPFIVRAQLANVLFGQGEDAFVTCSGKGMTRTAARDGALGEALERYASLTWTPDRTVQGIRRGLPGKSLDPRELVLYAPEDADRLGFARYHDDLGLDWVLGRSLVTGAEVWVPFQAATLHGSRWPHSQLLFAPTSNGFAAGPTVEFAAEQALLEVIERDAFCLAWAHRLATQPYAATSLPDADAAAVAELYRRRGVRIEVHLLPTDGTAFVAMAIGWGEEPAAVVGLGASQDPLRAARSAVLEVGQVRPALRGRLRDPEVRERRARLVENPALVAELEDHDLLYSDATAAAERMVHLRTSEAVDWVTPPTRGHGLDDLVASLAAVAGDVLIVDVTPADVAALGVRVVKGIVPSFQPIHFGADQARLGHSRLFDAPHRWGLRDRPADRADLNPDPHPLA
ncbi:TOMM precursor leader peptide-binding protein [Micropruina sp.]|uniref:TOMM precursor leader peptide-binding protein n=1 Tax=Micropruina sp. TaxID=2737536 RepID=UPI0039E5D8BC